MGKKIKSKASSHSSKATSCISRASTSTAIATAAATVDRSSPPIQKQQQQVNGKEKGSNHNRKGGRSKTITSTGGARVEDKELSRALLSSGYRIKYMVGDGNCLFRSIADQLR